MRTTLGRNLTVLAGLAALAASCAPSTLAPTTFDAQYTMKGSIGDFSTAPECARYSTLQIVAGDTSKVGVRYLEEGSERWDVGMTGDAEGWLRAGVENALRAASIEQDEANGHTVTVELVSITTDESVYRQAEYDGKVAIRARVTGGGADWSATKDGFAENYGSPGSALNYQETVNHALDRALAALVNDSGFRDALCG